MNIGESILMNLFGQYSIIDCIENIDVFKMEACCKNKIPLNTNAINEEINNISIRDKIRINIIEDEIATASFSSGDNINEFFEDYNLNDYEEEVKVSIIISKNEANKILSIYDLNKFIDYLESLSFKGIMSNMNKLINNKFIVFEVMNCLINEQSTSIFFKSSNLSVSCNINSVERKNLLRKREELVNWVNQNEIDLLPIDFHLINPENERIIELFNKLKVVLSIMNIVEIVDLKDSNKIKLTLNGYKRIDCTIDYKDLNLSHTLQYYNVYNWIYTHGSSIDKIDIARNVISLMCKDNNLFIIDVDLMPSIKSAHNIYLKENVSEYLDVKAKITEFLFDLTTKMSDLANDIGKALINNIIAFLGLYIGIFITSAFSEGEKEIFTKDISYMSIFLLLGSCGYLILSIVEEFIEYKRYKEIYDRFKESYNDILDHNDIELIFKNDEYLKKDRKYIIKKSCIYIFCWILVLVALFSFTYNRGYEHLRPIIDSIINLFGSVKNFV